MTRKEDDEGWLAAFMSVPNSLVKYVLFWGAIALVWAVCERAIWPFFRLIEGILAPGIRAMSVGQAIATRITFFPIPFLLIWAGTAIGWRALNSKPISRFLRRLLISRALCGLAPVVVAVVGGRWCQSALASALLVSSPVGLLCAVDALMVVRRSGSGFYGDCPLELAELVTQLRKGDFPPDDDGSTAPDLVLGEAIAR